MDKIIKILASCILIFSLITCKKEKKEISKGETETFLYGVGGATTDFANSEAGAAISGFLADPPFTPLNLSSKDYSIFEKGRKILNNLLGWSDSIKCIYGTWTHTDVYKEDTNHCGIVFWSNWDYVYDDTLGINFKWKFLFQADTHNAWMRLYNIQFVYDTLLSSLSVWLKSDDKEILNMDFLAEYNTSQKPVKGSFRIEFVNIGEFKIVAEAASGHTLEDSIFVGKISGYIKDYKQNNYTLNYFFENREDSSKTFWFSDTKGWKFYIDIKAPVHTQHPGYDPHYYHTVTGEITKDGKLAASIKGEIWVTDPPDDPQHQTWIYVVFPDGTERDIRQYIPIGSFLYALLK